VDEEEEYEDEDDNETVRSGFGLCQSELILDPPQAWLRSLSDRLAIDHTAFYFNFCLFVQRFYLKLLQIWLLKQIHSLLYNLLLQSQLKLVKKKVEESSMEVLSYGNH
jgi:hypothetical protein